MDMNGKSDVKEPLNTGDSKSSAVNGVREEDDESKLLLPSEKGGSTKTSGKPRRKVQWNDKNGHKLAEVLEFQPSDVSDSDDEDSDTCFCRIM